MCDGLDRTRDRVVVLCCCWCVCRSKHIRNLQTAHVQMHTTHTLKKQCTCELSHKCPYSIQIVHVPVPNPSLLKHFNGREAFSSRPRAACSQHTTSVPFPPLWTWLSSQCVHSKPVVCTSHLEVNIPEQTGFSGCNELSPSNHMITKCAIQRFETIMPTASASVSSSFKRTTFRVSAPTKPTRPKR